MRRRCGAQPRGRLRLARVLVAMMQVRVVWMFVPHRRVMMPVTMWLAGGIASAMSVLVMRVVDVIVFVVHRLVSVLMFVAFGEVQPDADAHQYRSANKRHGDRLPE